MSKINRLIFGNEHAEKIKHSNVLVIGAGGIGTELIKILTSSGFENITIVDYDEIERSNLSRQFYFREKDVGGPKVDAIKSKLKEIKPHVQITAEKGSITNKPFATPYYFRKFDIIYNAVDDLEARKVVMQLGLQSGRPVIDAGTGSRSGWVHPLLRNFRPCKYCHHVPEKKEDIPTCTLRANPTKTFHCVLWAKNLWENLFSVTMASKGDDWGNDFKRMFYQPETCEEDLKNLLVSKFQEFFYKTPLDLKALNQNLKIRPMAFEEALRIDIRFALEERKEGTTTSEDEYLTIKEHAELFISSALKLRKIRMSRDKPLIYSVDDADIVDFIFAATNLRVFNFNPEPTKQCSLVPIIRSKVKEQTKTIQPIIASTNAVIGALEVDQGLKLLTGRTEEVSSMQLKEDNARLDDFFGYYVIAKERAAMEYGTNRCKHCGSDNYFIILQANFETTTWKSLTQFIQQKISLPRGRLQKTNGDWISFDAPGPEYTENLDTVNQNQKLSHRHLKDGYVVLEFKSNCSKAKKGPNFHFMIMHSAEANEITDISADSYFMRGRDTLISYLAEQHGKRVEERVQQKMNDLIKFKFFD